jgi:hypothetical protein
MIKKIVKPFLALLLVGAAVTASANPFLLSADKRIDVVKVYLHDLQMADVHGITSLFVANGRVISTSQGCVNAAAFFNSFLPEIKSAKVTINHIYQSIDNKDHYSASFNFSWVMRDGSQSGGHYIDEFIFHKGTNKLVTVSMFENTKIRSS